MRRWKSLLLSEHMEMGGRDRETAGHHGVEVMVAVLCVCVGGRARERAMARKSRELSNFPSSRDARILARYRSLALLTLSV